MNKFDFDKQAMYKDEYPPLLPEGFKEIQLWQMDSEFLEPFGENEQRKHLIDRFNVFISEFKALGIDAEIWIDGSFGTSKPEPSDIDVLFLFDIEQVESLSERKQKLFDDLFINRDKVRTRYSTDVYFISNNDEIEKRKWVETYGFDFRKLNSKGIYKIIIQKGV